MKKKNIWLPISILLGILIAGAAALFAYILITGRNYYSSLPEYTLSEEVSSNVINIDQVSTAGSYKEFELDGFSVPSKAGSAKNSQIPPSKLGVGSSNPYRHFDISFYFHCKNGREKTQEPL